MIPHRIILALLLTGFAALAQTQTNAPPSGSQAGSTNAQLTLKALLDSALKQSGEGVSTNEKASIYSTRAVPSLLSLLRSLDPALKFSGADDGAAASVTCLLPQGTIRFTLKPWDGSRQRAAMKNWVSTLPGSDTNSPGMTALFHQVDATLTCIGVVITPRYDAAGQASALVLGVAAKLNGYVFTHQAFYSASGNKIAGRPDAAATLADNP